MEITSTPCIAICLIDPGTGLCLGCGRTRQELGDWTSMTEPQRLVLMAALPQRFVEVPGLAAARRAHDGRIAARGRVGRRRTA